MASDKGHPRFTAWLAGLVTGVGGGLVLLIFPILGLVLVAAGVVRIVRGHRRVAGGSGFSIGIGATTFALLLRAQLACEAFGAVASQGCDGPDLTPLLLIAGGLLVAGLVLSAVSLAPNRASRRGAR